MLEPLLLVRKSLLRVREEILPTEFSLSILIMFNCESYWLLVLQFYQRAVVDLLEKANI